MADSDEALDAIHDSATFMRQRRNALLLAIALILFQLAGGSLRKVPVGDAWVEFHNVGVLEWAAWLALAYALLRFYLHRGRRVVEFDGAFRNAVRIRARKYLLRRAEIDEGGQEFVQNGRNIPILPSVSVDARRPFRRVGIVSVGARVPDGKGGHKPAIDVPNPKFKVGLLRAWWYEVHAFALVAVRDPIVTELWLPYVLAAAAVFIALFRWASR